MLVPTIKQGIFPHSIFFASNQSNQSVFWHPDPICLENWIKIKIWPNYFTEHDVIVDLDQRGNSNAKQKHSHFQSQQRHTYVSTLVPKCFGSGSNRRLDLVPDLESRSGSSK
jgi:hypothetical protein